MPISEKDIFASLMQDPNHAYNPLEKVWAEAQQRARQFRNNEKALALAFGDSPALGKLFAHIQKADDEDEDEADAAFVAKVKEDFATKQPVLRRLLATWNKYGDTHGNADTFISGWGDTRPDRIRPNEQIHFSLPDPDAGVQLYGYNVDRRDEFNHPGLNIYDIGSYYSQYAHQLEHYLTELRDNPDSIEAGDAENLRKWFGEVNGEVLPDNVAIAQEMEDNSALNNRTSGLHNAVIQQRQEEELRGGGRSTPRPEGNEGNEVYQSFDENERRFFRQQYNIAANREEQEAGVGSRERENIVFPLIQDIPPAEFERMINHFKEGVDRFDNIEQRMDFWNAFEPADPQPEAADPDPQPNFDVVDDEESDESDTDDEEESDDDDDADPNAPPEPEPFSGNVKEGYEKFAPQTLNDENEAFTVLYPTIDGEEFKPFDNVGNNNQSEAYHETVKKLVQEYVNIHEGNSETPHLGDVNNYFPGEAVRSGWKFKPEDFGARKEKEYNKLNANKAIIEEYLRILFSAGKGHVDSSGQPFVKEWNDHRTREEREPPEDVQRRDTGQSFNQQMGEHTRSLLPEAERTETAVRMETIPHPGAWDWYQLLNTMQGLSSKLTLEGEDPDDYRDANDNPSFHLIPQSNFSRLGYPPTHRALENFSTLLEKRVLEQDAEMEGDEDSTSGPIAMGFDKNQLQLAQLRVDRKKAENPDDEAYVNFRMSGRDNQRNHFREAWNVFTAGKESGDIDPGEAFMDWLGMSEGFDTDDALWRQIPNHPDGAEWVRTYQTAEESDGDEEDEEGDDGDGEVTSPFEAEEAEWLREHPDFADVEDFDEVVRNLTDDQINDYKGQYTQYQENMAAYNEIPDELKQQYGYADWFGMSDEEREQVMNDHVVAQQQAEYDALSDNLKGNYQTAEEWHTLSPEEKEKAHRRDARTDDVNYILEYKKLTQHLTDAELKREEDFLYDRLDDKEFAKEFSTTMKLHGKFREKRREAEEKAEEEGRKPTGKVERTLAEFEELKENFKRVYERVHGRKVNEDAFNSWASDYETLDKEYKQALKVEHDKNNKEHQGMLESNANNIAGKDGIDPLPEPPTEDDLKHQIRQIQNWKLQHGAYMTDKKAKEALQQLETEAYQKANNAGFDAEDFIAQDTKDALKNGLDYGSAAWMEAVGKTHVDEQMKGARYRRQVQKGGELRANSNYKPWLVIQYDKDGNGTLFDLRSQQEVRREDLSFDKENPGFDYTGKNDLSQLADPESTFWDGLDYANLQPIRTDEAGGRSATQPPQIGDSPGRFGHRRTNHAWYHPESKSWINPHRYWDARDELNAATPGSGMLMLQGTGYHGKNQSGNRERHYGFQTMGDGIEGLEHSYYLDGQGNIVHVNTDYQHKNVSSDFSQPQTVNSVIHDWHSDHMQQQMKTNMGNWMEGDKPKDSVILSPQEQQGPTPLQNAVQVGDALHRRRQQGKLYGKRGFDTLYSDELGQDPTSYGKRGRMQRLTPRTATEKVKQGFIGAVGYTESGVLTGLAKLALNTLNIGSLGILGLGWGQEQDNIKRQRANYNRQAKLQRNVKQHMETVTDNGRQRTYISPGEQQARIEDHKNLKESLSSKQQLAQNRARDLRNAGDREGGAKAEADSIRFQALKQGIDKRQIENPADWEHINTLYEQHYGSPQVQATLAPAIGEQPSQNLADRFQPQPQQPSQPGETYPMMYDETPSQPKELVPNWS